MTSYQDKNKDNNPAGLNHVLAQGIQDVEEEVDKLLSKNKDKIINIITKNNIYGLSYFHSRIDLLLKNKKDVVNMKSLPMNKDNPGIYFVKKKSETQSETDKKTDENIDKIIDEVIIEKKTIAGKTKNGGYDAVETKDDKRIASLDFDDKTNQPLGYSGSSENNNTLSEEQKAEILDQQLEKHFTKTKASNTEDKEKKKQGILHIFKKTKQKQESALNQKQILPSDREITSDKPVSSHPRSIQVKSIRNTKFPDEVVSLKNNTLQALGLVDKQWEEMDFYALYEPFAYVEIIRDVDSLDKRYVLVESMLSEEEAQWLKFLKETLRLIPMRTVEVESKGLDVYLKEQIEAIIKEYKVNISDESKRKILYYIEKQYLGLDIIDALMRDPNIEDISCDGANVPIFLYHREYGSLKSNLVFNSEDELSSFVTRLAQKCGKHISISEPMLDATMPDGSRIQITLGTEVTAKGSTFTIRKFREDPFSPPDLIEFNTMSSEMVAYMWMAVENGVNALIAGGTAAGKTSTLNALSLFIPREAKIVSIEETREINLPHPNWIPGVVRSGFGEVVGDKIVGEIDMYDLMKAALRQRPEYILVGEIRGREAYVLFQAMATGHTTYSTAHADSAQSLIHRLEGKPIEIPRIMLQALDIVCIQVATRVKNKRARRCKQIIEIIDIDPTTKEILTNEVFRWDPIEDKYIYSGKSYVLENIRADKDMTREEMANELRNRARLLEWMNRMNIRDFREVSQIIAQYAEDPAPLLKKIKESVS